MAVHECGQNTAVDCRRGSRCRGGDRGGAREKCELQRTKHHSDTHKQMAYLRLRCPPAAPHCEDAGKCPHPSPLLPPRTPSTISPTSYGLPRTGPPPSILSRTTATNILLGPGMQPAPPPSRPPAPTDAGEGAVAGGYGHARLQPPQPLAGHAVGAQLQSVGAGGAWRRERGRWWGGVEGWERTEGGQRTGGGSVKGE